MVKKWNYSNEKDFFASRGRVKSVPKQRISKHKPRVEEQSLQLSNRGNAYKHTRSGARLDLPGITPRSGWEANVMRVLNAHRVKYLFEPMEFKFPLTPQGRTSMYIPDIYLIETDEYIEVKGYLDGRGRNKLRKFKKHYPKEFSTLTVIISRSNKANKRFFEALGVISILYYENIADVYSDKLLNWEGKK